MKTKKVTLPSGLEVTIREMSTLTAFAVGKATGDNNEYEVGILMIEGCTVEPKFGRESSDGVMGLDELPVSDGVALLNAIKDLTGDVDPLAKTTAN